MSQRIKVAEQTYTLAEVCRLFHISRSKARDMMIRGELVGADVMVPGGGRKAERWTASRLAEVCRRWSVAAPL